MYICLASFVCYLKFHKLIDQNEFMHKELYETAKQKTNFKVYFLKKEEH